MSNGHRLVRMKPVFPVLYLGVFTYTVVHMYMGYVSGDPPPIIKGVVGETNQQTVLWVTYIFAFLLCFYDVLYYARLEMFEHTHKPQRTIPPAIAFFEFSIRFLLVGIVALKVIQYDVLNDLFEFSAIMCLLISLWLIYLKLFHIDKIRLLDLAQNIIVCILSIIATYFTSAPEKQIDHAVLVSIAAVLLSIFLSVGVVYLTLRFGKDLYELICNFLTQWEIHSETEGN